MRLGLGQLFLICLLVFLFFGNFEKIKVFLEQKIQEIKNFFS